MTILDLIDQFQRNALTSLEHILRAIRGLFERVQSLELLIKELLERQRAAEGN